MTYLQKYILHPVMALIFAFGVARFVEHFQLLEFAYGAVLSFIFVFLGTLLLARKYDLSLTYIFLAGALFIGYKAFSLTDKKQVVSDTSDQVVVEKLNSMAALVKYAEIERGNLPKTLIDVDASLIEAQDIRFEYCHENKVCLKDFLLQDHDSSFYIVAKQDLTENKQNIWYIDDEFIVYKIQQTGDIRKIFP